MTHRRRRHTRRGLLGTLATGTAAAWATATGGSLSGRPAGGWPYPAADPSFPDPEYIDTNGIRMAVYHQGDGTPVVFSHGFPELAYSWRHQLPALAGAGFHAIAPDQRGYGFTQRPVAVEAYRMEQLCGDLVGLLDALGHERAVFVGHDWGGGVIWSMGLLHPDRVLALIGVNTPFGARPPAPPIGLLRSMRGENNYVVAFQQPDEPERILGRDVRRSFEFFMRRGMFDAETFAALPADAPERKFELLQILSTDFDPAMLPGEQLLSEDELEVYVEAFTRTGFTGGVNWYRNIDRNWHDTEGMEYRIDAPALYVGAEDDVVLPPSSAHGMEERVPKLEKVTIADCGHWTQQEKPDELNHILIDWLRKTLD